MECTEGQPSFCADGEQSGSSSAKSWQTFFIPFILKAKCLPLPGGSFCLSEVTSSIFSGPKACRSWWVGNRDLETKRQRKKNIEVPEFFCWRGNILAMKQESLKIARDFFCPVHWIFGNYIVPCRGLWNILGSQYFCKLNQGVFQLGTHYKSHLRYCSTFFFLFLKGWMQFQIKFPMYSHNTWSIVYVFFILKSRSSLL